MGDAYWLDDFTTLDLKTPSGGTAIPVAGVQDVTIVPSVSIEHLYTADSIKPNTRKQHEFSVNVQLGYSLWDVDVVRQWLDETAASDGTNDPVSMTDTSDPATYSLDGTFANQDDSVSFSATVDNITFEEMPIIDASRGEFVQWDLDGTGEDLTGFEEV